MTTTREALIRAATDLLDAGGREHVTLREVGRRAGVSHNAPYKHFTDKEALLAAVATEELFETARIIRTASESSGLETALRAMIAHSIARPQRFRLVYGTWTGEPEDLGAAADTAWQALLDAVEREQTAKRLPSGDALRLAELVRVIVHGAVDLALSGHLSESKTVHGTPESIVSAGLELLRSATNTASIDA